jgi:AcrR family transcriptional regulator
MPRTRTYSSPLRRQQRESTRQLILRALASLIAEGRIHTFSVEDVARRAGVSYASVYKHFPSREKLLEGLYEWGSELVRSEMPPPPRALGEIPAWVAAAIPVAEKHAAINQAVATVLAALRIDPPSRRRRDVLVEKLIARGAPGLPPKTAREAAAVIRHLAGSESWSALRRRFGLDAAQTSAALTWALNALIRDLKRRGAR